MLLRPLASISRDPRRWVEILARRLVFNQFERANQTLAPRLADHRVLSEFLQSVFKRWGDAANMANDVALFVNLEGFERHGRRHGMASVSEAVPESSDCGALRHDRAIDLFVDHQRR